VDASRSESGLVSIMAGELNRATGALKAPRFADWARLPRGSGLRPRCGLAGSRGVGVHGGPDHGRRPFPQGWEKPCDFHRKAISQALLTASARPLVIGATRPEADALAGGAASG
jgi:hypothetical protein